MDLGTLLRSANGDKVLDDDVPAALDEPPEEEAALGEPQPVEPTSQPTSREHVIYKYNFQQRKGGGVGGSSRKSFSNIAFKKALIFFLR